MAEGKSDKTLTTVEENTGQGEHCAVTKEEEEESLRGTF